MWEANPSDHEMMAKKVAETFWSHVGGRKFDPTDQLGDCFNPILSGGGQFVMGIPSSPVPSLQYRNPDDDSLRVKGIAFVLREIAEKLDWTATSSSEPTRLGWDGLNADAKGWCRAVATASIPHGLSSEALLNLLEARRLIFEITGYHLANAIRGREVILVANREQLIGGNDE